MGFSYDFAALPTFTEWMRFVTPDPQTTDLLPSSLLTHHSSRSWWLVPALLLACAGLLLAVDLPIARFCDADDYPKEVSDVLNNAEPFGHGIGVAFVVITIAVLDARRRRWAPALCAAGALAGGLAANILKLVVSRTRPRNFDLAGTDVWATFQHWLPLGAGGSKWQSFPSAHMATAMGFAMALSAVYPRGRWWFFTMAALVGLHRIEVSAHYPSDVCAGAALGWVAGHLAIALTQRLAKPELEVVPESAPAMQRAA